MIAVLMLLAPACDGRATPLRARGRPVAVAGGGPPPPPRLSLRQHALAGAFARAVAQSCVHPLNVAKTTLQTANGPAALRAMTSGGLFSMATWRHLSRGLGAQALLSMPNGAINFCVMEGTRRFICSVAPRGGALIGMDFRPSQDVRFGFGLGFSETRTSSAGNRTSSTGLHALAYGGLDMDRWFVDGAAGLSHFDSSTTRSGIVGAGGGAGRCGPPLAGSLRRPTAIAETEEMNAK